MARTTGKAKIGHGVVTLAGSLALFLIFAATVLAVSINWGAGNHPIYDETGVGGVLLGDGDVVQLIWDADQDGIDPPGGDGLPQDGDQLLDVSAIGVGAFPNSGKFSDNVNTNIVGVGAVVYVRAWNASSLAAATQYGNSPLATVTSNVAFTFDCTAAGSFATTNPLVPNCIPGDVDCSCQVDVYDILLVAGSWLAMIGDPNYVATYDVNGDFVIDVVDLMIVTAHFGDTC
jgi:hypothetical protein